MGNWKAGWAYEEYQRLKDNGVEIISLDHKIYPKNVLKLMEDGAPPLLFCKGQLSLLKSEGIAIVGSRNASGEGVKMVKQFAAELAMQGENVISGYAKGID
ncbi:MAG: DNA-protecting protein DprA, partial [bacterium (Candidatus Ratteibacteria) CG_4_9_14_3_um_filter_41_21]